MAGLVADILVMVDLVADILVMVGLVADILRALRHHPSPKFHRLWTFSYKRNLF
jgi:hypothetical protein